MVWIDSGNYCRGDTLFTEKLEIFVAKRKLLFGSDEHWFGHLFSVAIATKTISDKTLADDRLDRVE